MGVMIDCDRYFLLIFFLAFRRVLWSEGAKSIPILCLVQREKKVQNCCIFYLLMRGISRSILVLHNQTNVRDRDKAIRRKQQSK